MKQPEERSVKEIFVTARADKRVVMALVTATKVGDHYRISPEALQQLLDQLGVIRGDTYIIG